MDVVKRKLSRLHHTCARCLLTAVVTVEIMHSVRVNHPLPSLSSCELLADRLEYMI